MNAIYKVSADVSKICKETDPLKIISKEKKKEKKKKKKKKEEYLSCYSFCFRNQYFCSVYHLLNTLTWFIISLLSGFASRQDNELNSNAFSRLLAHSVNTKE